MVTHFNKTIALLAIVAGCETSDLQNSSFHNADTISILDRYRAENTAVELGSARHLDSLISVSHGRDGMELSAQYERVPTGDLARKIAEIGQLSFAVDGAAISGQSSGEFRLLSPQAALAHVLRQAGYSLTNEAGTWVIRADLSAWLATHISDDSGIVSAEIPLTFIRAANISETISDLAEDADIQFIPNTTRNSVILTGDYASVVRVASVTRSLDIEPEHILVEALIVEFNLERLRDIGSELADGRSGEFADVFYNLIGDGAGLAFSFDGAATPSATSFMLVLEFLVQNNAAHVLSRPFVTTLSGEAAVLEISEDRFVETVVLDEAELNEVSSGVRVNVTPTALTDRTIAIDYEVSESRFAATEDESDLRRSQNAVTSSAVVANGQTIVIGGLSLKTRAQSTAGYPSATRVPLLGSLLGHQAHRKQDTEVMMFVTPRIWAPGLDIPVPTEDAVRDHAQNLE